MTTNLQLARKVAQHVQIENIVLRKAEVEAHFEPHLLPSELSLEHGYRTAYEIQKADNLHRLSVIVDFKLEARAAPAGESGESIADLFATFHLFYILPIEFQADDACFEQFSAVNGVYNAWPYWRELVQTSTSRIGLPGVVLPVFRPTSKEMNESQQDAMQSE